MECLECVHDTLPTLTPEMQAQRAANQFNSKAGPILSKHLACPYCTNYYSSLPALRFHKLEKHTEVYNEERRAKGLRVLLPPSKVRRLNGEMQSVEKKKT